MKIDPDLMLACASVLAHSRAYPDPDEAVRGSALVVASRARTPTDAQILMVTRGHFGALGDLPGTLLDAILASRGSVTKYWADRLSTE